MERERSRKFEDLIVWQKTHRFVLAVYKFTDKFPKDELYGLTSQLRRAAVSIAANIVEGFKKNGKQDKVRFYNISQGSVEECRYYLILSKNLGYEQITELNNQLEEVSKLLYSYASAVTASKF